MLPWRFEHYMNRKPNDWELAAMIMKDSVNWKPPYTDAMYGVKVIVWSTNKVRTYATRETSFVGSVLKSDMFEFGEVENTDGARVFRSTPNAPASWHIISLQRWVKYFVVSTWKEFICSDCLMGIGVRVDLQPYATMKIWTLYESEAKWLRVGSYDYERLR